MSNVTNGTVSGGLVLGIDLGANSLGVALIDVENQKIVHTGVRIFEAGVNSLDTAKEQTKNVERREARQVRKQTDRRKRRYAKLFQLLQQNGLLPEGKRQESLEALDRELSKKFNEHGKLHYFLRARALDEILEPFELGRALYHLGQRRGFLSNRKFSAKASEQDEKGKVKEGIQGLREQIASSGCRTLGEYFYRTVDPHQERIRKRYTHRDMYSEEFALVWAKQSGCRVELLTEKLREQIYGAIFDQRPLKDQSDKIGFCALEPSERRAPMASLEVQQLRVLLAVNNLRVFFEEGNSRTLSAAERASILPMTESKDKLTLAAVKTHLKLPRTSKFSIEAGGEKNLPVNATATRLRKVLGSQWDQLPEDERVRLVEILMLAKGTEEALAADLIVQFGFDATTAQKLAEEGLPESYYSISLKAIRKILPHAVAGLDHTSAVMAIDEYRLASRSEPLSMLPGIVDSLPEVRNPIVMRSLTELRKTVNALIREYGPIDTVRIELARDIRRGHEERMRMQKNNRDRESDRDKAKAELAKYLNCKPDDVKQRDVEKYLLWEECHYQCPYTGREISMEALFGPHPLFQIEHIVPLSRSLDNSFNNKTLCATDQNALKRNRTPWEAFGHDAAEWERMVAAVKSFNRPAKLSRFILTEADQEAMLAEFTTRQLNDTRYASKLAARYLGLLFGGTSDDSGRQRVFTCAGQVTALLRREWKLNGILNPEDHTKTREDHRHHAVDAVTIAMSSPAIIKLLSDAAQRAGTVYRYQFGGYFLPPWDGFQKAVDESIQRINVSLRPEYKLRATMHDQTLYSRAWVDKKDGKKYVSVRKPVEAAKVEDIIDDATRCIVAAKIAQLGNQKALGTNPPLDAAGRPIRKVRVKISIQTELETVGVGPRSRNVMPNSIHHTEILLDEIVPGKSKYRHVTVNTIEAMQRQKNGVPVVQKDHGERVSFICSLRPGDVIEADKGDGKGRQLWRMRSLKTSGQFELHQLTDARIKRDIQTGGDLWAPRVANLFFSGSLKVSIDHLGIARRAND